MINGDLNEFVDIANSGGELFFLYKEKKYFLQGWFKDNQHIMVLDCLDDEITENYEIDQYIYLWETKEKLMSLCAEKFLEAKLWNGRNFWQAEHEIEWFDL